MPDKRKHRGPHPEDERRFGAEAVSRLCDATGDVSWLLSRGYAVPSTIKLVGDRYQLDARQRVAVGRCACSDDQMVGRQSRQLNVMDLDQREVWVDGFNVLTTIEASLSGGAILHARDGCYRDMASMHGSYKRVDETQEAIRLIGRTLESAGIAHVRWLLDQPVSNSGRLKTMLGDIATEWEWPWSCDLVPDPDVILKQTHHVVATADSVVLDHSRSWVNLASTVVGGHVPAAWIVDLADALTY